MNEEQFKVDPKYCRSDAMMSKESFMSLCKICTILFEGTIAM